MASRNITSNNFSIKLEDNSKEVKAELDKKIGLILEAIGVKWMSLVSKEITVRRIVDSGELRRTMDYEVDKVDNVVVVGSPLKYATKQEFENKKGPYLKPSILDYKESYQNIAESILKE